MPLAAGRLEREGGPTDWSTESPMETIVWGCHPMVALGQGESVELASFDSTTGSFMMATSRGDRPLTACHASRQRQMSASRAGLAADRLGRAGDLLRE